LSGKRRPDISRAVYAFDWEERIGEIDHEFCSWNPTAHRTGHRIRDLVKPEDLTRGHTDVPVRFEIEAEINGVNYSYGIASELPEGFKELRVAEEKLTVDGRPIYTRELAQVRLARTRQDQEAPFRIDWHLVALPIVQEQSQADPLYVFKRWLSRMLILRPIPSLIKGDSEALRRGDTDT
jgi:hypothetical protein